MGRAKIDLTGRVVGNLVVLHRIDSNRQGVVWLCQCKCGKTTTAATGVLNNKTRTSCGCIHVGRENSKFKGYQDIGGCYWRQVEAGARRRGIEFSITMEYVWDLYESQGRKCSLSGLSIVLHPSATNKSKYQTASLDRIDNSLGYVKGNVQWLHKDVNRMKNVHSQEYFIKMCNLISLRSGSGCD